MLIVAMMEVDSCLPQGRGEVVPLLASVFEEVLRTVQLPLAQIEHALAYPRQLRHVVDSVSTSEMAQRRRVPIVPCASVSAIGCLLDGVRRQCVENANSSDIKSPSIVRIESLCLWRERFDDLIQDAPKMSFRALPVIFYLVQPRIRQGGWVPGKKSETARNVQGKQNKCRNVFKRF